MNGRGDRILVPSAVALIATGVTLWLASGGTKGPTDWFGSSDPILKFLVGAGIVTVGMGYLCSAIFTLRMLSSETCRLIDFSELMSAFGLRIQPGVPNKKQLIRQLMKPVWSGRRSAARSGARTFASSLEERLLNEFHLRLHSHAPQSLIDHCSRRNTAWYIAETSAVASWVGWLVALIILLSGRGIGPSCKEIAGIVASFLVFFIVIPLALCWQGTRWNQEFWGVCWKWIAWDRQSHRAPHGWLGELPAGVEWMSELDG